MTDDQRQRIKPAMDAYEFYLENGVSTFTSEHINAVAKVRKELKMTASVCRGCLGEIVEYMKVIYELYKV